MDKEVAEKVTKGVGAVLKTGLKALGIVFGCAVAGGVAAGVAVSALGAGGWAVALGVLGGLVVGKLGGDLLAAKYLSSKMAPVAGAAAGFLADVSKNLETAPSAQVEPALTQTKDLGGEFAAANSNEATVEAAATPVATAEKKAAPKA